MTENSSCRRTDESLQEYGRGIAGGLLFSLPLLYTMEVWWHGFVAHPGRLLAGVAATFVLLLGYNRYAGLHEDATWQEVVIDSVEELGIGIVISTFILWLLGRITPGMSADEVMGKIILEAVTVAIGVSVGTAQLGTPDDSGDSDDGDEDEKTPDYIKQVVMGLCGAVLIAANVGPTEEIIVLAIENPPVNLLGLVAFSLLMSGLILHYSDFRGAKFHVPRETSFQIARGVVTTYAVALAASAGICWFYGRLDDTALPLAISHVVVLAFPATLGASAGRLLLQSNKAQ